jgi:Putative metal-binding motif
LKPISFNRVRPSSHCIATCHASAGYTIAGSTVTLHGAACDALQAAARADASAHLEVREGCACVPQSEVCGNQRDDDCDGRADEGCPPSAVCGVDTAASECDVGECDAPEVCNGRDDDCDGAIDEGCAPVCTTKQPEVCNGRDDDCDGAVDEDCPRGCTPSPEICDGRDNDCDGVVDPDCALCRPWLEVCDGEDNDCDGVVDDACLSCPLPANEVCDGEDNDCDGEVDEGCPPLIVL